MYGVFPYGIATYGATYAPPLYPDLTTAVIARLRDPIYGVAPLFGDDPATIQGNKFWGNFVAPKTTLPWARLVEIGEDDAFQSFDSSGVAYTFPIGSFQVSVFAANRAQAVYLGNRVTACLNDAPLAFADGVVLEFRRTHAMDVPEFEIGANQPQVFHRALTFLYRLQRTY